MKAYGLLSLSKHACSLGLCMFFSPHLPTVMAAFKCLMSPKRLTTAASQGLSCFIPLPKALASRSLQVCCTPSALTCHGWCLQLFVVASNLISKLCHHFHQCSNLGKIESSPLGVSREIRTMKTIFAHFLQLNGKNQELDSSF